jgi:hypothetical protein
MGPSAVLTPWGRRRLLERLRQVAPHEFRRPPDDLDPARGALTGLVLGLILWALILWAVVGWLP